MKDSILLQGCHWFLMTCFWAEDLQLSSYSFGIDHPIFELIVFSWDYYALSPTSCLIPQLPPTPVVGSSAPFADRVDYLDNYQFPQAMPATLGLLDRFDCLLLEEKGHLQVESVLRKNYLAYYRRNLIQFLHHSIFTDVSSVDWCLCLLLWSKCLQIWPFLSALRSQHSFLWLSTSYPLV